VFQFNYDVNLDEAANEIRTRVDRDPRSARREQVQPPTIFKFDTIAIPDHVSRRLGAIWMRASCERFSRRIFSRESSAFPALRPSIFAAVCAARSRSSLQIEKLRSYNLSVNQIVNILRAENQNRPVGPMEEGQYEVLLRSQGEFAERRGDLAMSSSHHVAAPRST
jgi:HAE1 family hydrophobic/amphiphilic exporter-1